MRNIFLVIVIAMTWGCSGSDKKLDKTQVSYDGEKLFKENCASCHKCVGDFNGPQLSGALERWGDKVLMYEFIKSPFSVMQRSEYAKNLQKKYGGAIMTPSTLSDKEIDAILDYCSNDDPAPVPGK